MTDSVLENIVDDLAAFDLTTLPASVVDKAKTSVLYHTCLALAGRSSSETIFDHLGKTYGAGGPRDARLIPDGTRMPGPQAAFGNAALFHARVQDDTDFPSGSHPACMILPAAFAAAEMAGSVDGSSVLEGVIAGYQAIGLLGGVSAVPGERGLRGSPLYGPFGAAAAAGKILDLDHRQLISALSLAGHFASGLKQVFAAGTDEWQVHAAHASALGVTSALQAADGIVSAPDAIEGEWGFFAAHAQLGEADVRSAIAKRRREWMILRSNIKPFPCCSIHQGSVTLLLELMQEHRLVTEKIASVTVGLNPKDKNTPGVDNIGPYNNRSQTLMSAQFCLATAATYGTIGFSSLSEFDDVRRNALARQVSIVADDEVQRKGCWLKVETTDGALFEANITIDSNTFNWDIARARTHIDAHVRDDIGLPVAQVNQLCDEIERLDEIKSFTRLLDLMIN